MKGRGPAREVRVRSFHRPPPPPTDSISSGEQRRGGSGERGEIPYLTNTVRRSREERRGREGGGVMRGLSLKPLGGRGGGGAAEGGLVM